MDEVWGFLFNPLGAWPEPSCKNRICTICDYSKELWFVQYFISYNRHSWYKNFMQNTIAHYEQCIKRNPEKLRKNEHR